MNGFPALAEFDKPESGGNSDGVIGPADSIYPYLRLCQDVTHDGVSQPEESHTLPSLNVVRLQLCYKESKKVDTCGNEFRYRAKVRDAKGAKVGRWTWDVFLLSGQLTIEFGPILIATRTAGCCLPSTCRFPPRSVPIGAAIRRRPRPGPFEGI